MKILEEIETHGPPEKLNFDGSFASYNKRNHDYEIVLEANVSPPPISTLGKSYHGTTSTSVDYNYKQVHHSDHKKHQTGSISSFALPELDFMRRPNNN